MVQQAERPVDLPRAQQELELEERHFSSYFCFIHLHNADIQQQSALPVLWVSLEQPQHADSVQYSEQR